MERLEGERESPRERPEQTGSSLLPKHGKGGVSNSSSKVGSAPEATLGDSSSGDAAEAASATAPTVEKYPSYIRRQSSATEPAAAAAASGGTKDREDAHEDRETEKGYEGGDRVRLLVGRYAYMYSSSV